MQNSNLSSKIFPIIREDWLSFIQKVEKELQDMITNYNNDKRRIKELDKLINKIGEIKDISKDKQEEILNYKELFMYIDNSLESSFDALKFFKEKGNFDNPAVLAIYGRIVNSPKILKINSEYSSLTIKVQFDRERIKKLGELIRGSKVDYILIKELVNKYKYSDNEKKNILFYPVVMLSIKQNDLKNSKENETKKKEEKEKFYRDRFNELCKKYQEKKENNKDLLIKCFNSREKMNHREVNAYNAFVNNPEEINEYDFDDDVKFKIYTLSFFKIKKDIENFINGINDLTSIENDFDDELAFLQEMILEFESIANKLKELDKQKEIVVDENTNKVFFALDAFNRLLIDEDLLFNKNRSGIKAIIQKVSGITNSKIDGAKTSHMLGVEEAEQILGKNISLLVTSKLLLAYVMVGKNVLIITGENINTDKFDKIVNRTVERNIIPIKRQIELIEEKDLDYLEYQNKIIDDIIGEEEKKVM